MTIYYVHRASRSSLLLTGCRTRCVFEARLRCHHACARDSFSLAWICPQWISRRPLYVHVLHKGGVLERACRFHGQLAPEKPPASLWNGHTPAKSVRGALAALAAARQELALAVPFWTWLGEVRETLASLRLLSLDKVISEPATAERI